jgi:hypothetical protein
MASSTDGAITDTPSTKGITTPPSARYEYETIRVMRLEDPLQHHLSVPEAPKLRLKLRNLAPKVSNGVAGEMPGTVLTHPALQNGLSIIDTAAQPLGQQKASPASHSVRPTEPLAQPLQRAVNSVRNFLSGMPSRTKATIAELFYVRHLCPMSLVQRILYHCYGSLIELY